MLQIRISIVLLTLLVPSVSIGQTTVVEPSASVAISPKPRASALSSVMVAEKVQSPEVSDTATSSFSPAPSIPSFETKHPLVRQVSSSSVVTNPSIYPSNKQVYSPQRDGLPTLEQRRQLRAMPIEQRPNRPFHFYGNTVRRRMNR